MKVTILIIASLLLASSVLSTRPAPTPPKCKAFTGKQINKAIDCIVGGIKPANKACTNKKGLLLARFADRVARNNAARFANVDWVSAGFASYKIDLINNLVANGFEKPCAKGRIKSYYNAVISVIHNVANNRKFKKNSTNKWEKYTVYDTCTTTLVHVASQTPALGLSTQTFVNYMIGQYNADKTGKFDWTVGSKYDKWVLRQTKNIKNQLTGRGRIINAINSVLKRKTYGNKKCSDVYRNTIAKATKCWVKKNGDIKKTPTYKWLTALAPLAAAGKSTATDKTSWFNSKTKYDAFVAAARSAFNAKFGRCVFAQNGAGEVASAEEKLPIQDYCFNTFKPSVEAALIKCQEKRLNKDNKKTLKRERKFNTCVAKATWGISHCPVNGVIVDNYDHECASSLFADHYNFAIKKSEVPSCVNKANHEFNTKLWKCSQKQHCGDLSSIKDRVQFKKATERYNACLEEAGKIDEDAKYSACATFLKQNPPKKDPRAACLGDMEAQFATDVTAKCASKKWPIAGKPEITKQIVNRYHNCLDNKFKTLRNRPKFKKCKNLFHLDIGHLTRKEISGFCVASDVAKFNRSGVFRFKRANGTVVTQRGLNPAAVCQKKTRKQKKAWKNWTRAGKTVKKIANSKAGQFYNHCFYDAVNNWAAKKGNKLCQHDFIAQVHARKQFPSNNNVIFNVAACRADGNEYVKNLVKISTTFNHALTVLQNRALTTNRLDRIFKGPNALIKIVKRRCGVNSTVKRPALKGDFNWRQCQKNGYAALRNYVNGCQRHAVNNKTLDTLKKQQDELEKCLNQGVAVRDEWNNKKCGTKTTGKNKTIDFKFNRFKRTGTQKVKVTVKANGHSSRHWNTGFISHLKLWQFKNQCNIWLNNVYNSNTENEYKEIVADLEEFVKAYKTTNDKAKCDVKHNWNWVKSHHTVHHSTVISNHDSHWINGLMDAAEPHGINHEYSLVAEAEHLECIVGHNEQETIANFNKEAQWWLAHMRGCKSQAQYIHSRQQYYKLIEEYEVHHYHVRAQAPACPQWSEITSH